MNELNVFFPIDDELKSAHIKSAKKKRKKREKCKRNMSFFS